MLSQIKLSSGVVVVCVCVGGEGCFILSDWSALCQVALFGNTRQPEESEVEW